MVLQAFGIMVTAASFGFTNELFFVSQGKPTQAMKEAETLEYGKLAAKDYIPGAEILRETSEVEDRQNEQGYTTWIILIVHHSWYGLLV